MNSNADFTIAWVLILPILGFLIQAFLGKRMIDPAAPAAGRRVMGTLAVLPIAIAFVLGVLVTIRLAGLPSYERSVVVPLFEWIDILGLRLPFELIVDPLSMTMVLIITGIGSLIHLYATGYMADERDYPRFFTYLNLFIASMLILVLGNNLALLFIGWEGVGLCSYLLIGFWYKDIPNCKAANKAFIVNRIGDWGLTLGLFLIVAVLGSTNQGVEGSRYLSYDTMIPALVKALAHSPGLATAIALLLFIGACGKSAQFPLYLWLPDAMAGPTPVSALIHAATMVTSGVVLLNRMHVVFEMSPVASAIVACVGAFTALFAALVAFGQVDIKKVLAYSTVSQLGFMFIGCGVGAYWSGMFHVTTHAFFKALLFLGSGAVITAMAHNQDMRNYGRLSKYLPITCWTMFVAYLAIAGISIPYVFGFAGFYSKEAILGSALANQFPSVNGVPLGQWAGWVGLFAAALTAMYMTRLTWLTFFGKEERWRSIPVSDEHEHEHHALGEVHDEHVVAHADPYGFYLSHEEAAATEHGEAEHHHALDASHTPKEVMPSMYVPLIVLAFFSAVGGWALERNEMFRNWLYPPHGMLPVLGDVKSVPSNVPIVWLSFAAAGLGIIAGIVVYSKGLPSAESWDLRKWSPFRRWAGNQFGFDAAMVSASVEGGAELANFAWKGVDIGIIDRIVNGAGWFAEGLGGLVSFLQTGYIRMYALMMLLGGAGILGWMFYAAHQVAGAR